jgi:hypothetical protein
VDLGFCQIKAEAMGRGTFAEPPTAAVYGQRELIISTGASGYWALYRYDPGQDAVFVLAVCSQRDRDYKRT